MEEKAPEEKAPLLLYLSEASENNNNASKNNKRIYFEKGRLYGISSGATAVFTEFPSMVSTCWLTTILTGLIMFIMFLLMYSSMVTNISYLRVPRCVNKRNGTLEMATIHLVHENVDWNNREIEILERIIKKFPGYKVHILVLDLSRKKKVTHHPGTAQMSLSLNNFPRSLPRPLTNKNHSQPMNNQNVTELQVNNGTTIGFLNKMYRPLKRVKRKKIDDLGFSVKRLLDMLLRTGFRSSLINGSVVDARFPVEMTTEKPKIRNAMLFPKIYPKVEVGKITYDEEFSGTPLQNKWPLLNYHLKMFAIRIIELWQYGGISLSLQDHTEMQTQADNKLNGSMTNLNTPNTTQTTSKKNTYDEKLFSFVDTGLKKYENLPKARVISDEDGLHIFSKTPCHSFFGEVLLKLAETDHRNENATTILKAAIRVFCQYAPAKQQPYCKNQIL